MKGLRKSNVGNWCLVKYDDIGVVTGLIVAAWPNDQSADVYVLALDTVERVDKNQIIHIGARVSVPKDAIKVYLAKHTKPAE